MAFGNGERLFDVLSLWDVGVVELCIGYLACY